MVHIPAHHEDPFRPIVNTHSGKEMLDTRQQKVYGATPIAPCPDLRKILVIHPPA